MGYGRLFRLGRALSRGLHPEALGLGGNAALFPQDPGPSRCHQGRGRGCKAKGKPDPATTSTGVERP